MSSSSVMIFATLCWHVANLIWPALINHASLDKPRSNAGEHCVMLCASLEKNREQFSEGLNCKILICFSWKPFNQFCAGLDNKILIRARLGSKS